MRLTIELRTIEEIHFIKRLLSRLDVRILSEEPTPQPTSQDLAFHALTQIAERNQLTSFIPDPVAWQNQERQDRDLPFQR